MSSPVGITLEEAQAQLAAHLAAEGKGVLLFRYKDRMVQYETSKEMRDNINFWQRKVNELSRVASRRPRHGFSTAKFGSGQ